jgi:AcrR family transcriptional regulator
MATRETPRRADAQRNREKILATASALFAERGDTVQMDEVAKRSGLGLGTVYRRFPTKSELLAAIVARRFEEMAEIAHTAASIDDPGEAFESLLRSYLEAAEKDAGFRVVLLGPEDFNWGDLVEQKTAFLDVAEPVIARAIKSGYLRADFVTPDFIMITRGIMTNMTPKNDWRRHLQLALEGVRVIAPQPVVAAPNTRST